MEHGILVWIRMEDFKGYRVWKIAISFLSIACPDD